MLLTGTDKTIALIAIIVVAVATMIVGSLGVRVARTTDDFLSASRTVGSAGNAAAISGQYLSAASFLGVAGMVLTEGADALWFPIGFTAGYLALLLFVAAPLRRSGAYTVPDFAEVRLDSGALRTATTWFVVIIGWLYLLPQLQAAGLTLTVVTGFPPWVGIVVVGVAITAGVTFGGMRSMTFVQAFHYWLKLTALGVPALVLLAALVHGSFSPSAPASSAEFATRPTTVHVGTSVSLDVPRPVTFDAHGTVDGRPAQGQITWGPGRHTVAEDTTMSFPAGSPLPVVAGAATSQQDWLKPLDPGAPSMLRLYSLVVALFLGTMALPHVLVRYYTNPDGRAARRTTVLVLVMLGSFYLLPVLLGVFSRIYVPQLLVTGETDAAVLLLPSAAIGGWGGTVLGALIAAGAFAALLAAGSGLLLSVAGVLSTDLLPRKVGDFRIAAHVAGFVPMLFALVAVRLDFAITVAMAFAVAASTFCPLLVLGIWWRGLTDRGAMAGMLAGGGLATVAVLLTLLGVDPGGAFGVLMQRPAIVTVPVSFVVMVLVSRATSQRVPPTVSRTLLRLHAPERLGLGEARRPARPSL